MLATPKRLSFFFLVAMLWPVSAWGDGVEARFDLTSPDGCPFPSDIFTAPDAAQLTGLRVDLPNPAASEDIDVLNELDGFSLVPRLSVPFGGGIDPSTAASASVLVFRLGAGGVAPIGIERRVWDPTTSTLYAEPAELLEPNARYALVVTRGVADAAGLPVQAAEAFRKFRRDLNYGHNKDLRLKAYREALIGALEALESAGVPQREVVAASVFTTQSDVAVLERLRDEIKAAPPPAVDFDLIAGGPRTVFPIAQVTRVTWQRHFAVAGPLQPAFVLPFNVVKTAQPAVGTIAFGRYLSTHYLSPSSGLLEHPVVGTAAGTPGPIAPEQIYFNLFLPGGAKPAAGWPVTLALHGGGNSNMNSPWRVADRFASRGVATIAINGAGAGFGPLGTLTVTRASGPVTFLMGGRAVDSNGNGTFEAGEGGGAVAGSLVGGRDAHVQDIADYMRLIRMIEGGVDVDGDGTIDLDPTKIFCYGHSRGGRQGITLAVLDSSVRALAAECPGITYPFDSLPLRGGPPVTIDAGTNEIQEREYRSAWAEMPGGVVACARHLRSEPLLAHPARVMIVFPRADRTVPNPMTSALVRAGDLQDRVLFFHADLFLADNPAVALLTSDPHSFAAFGNNPAGSPVAQALAKATQESMASFFQWGGTGEDFDVPLGFEAYFEAPMTSPLPEDLGYAP